MTKLLRVVFASPRGAEEWLQSLSPMLGDRTPASLIQEGRSHEVIAVLAGLAAGAHL
ncbi:MAG TPA: antitoxin Xre/MbcA/ParS toxin-binding domain-containing protein [Geminicoccaceae bacterium]